MKNVYIHGENALIPINDKPEGLFKKFTKFIVGHSETGHHHVLESVKGKEFEIAVIDGEIYITSEFKSSLVHKKTHDIHKTIEIQPGLYKVNRKKEYDPFEKVVRDVWD